MCKSRGFILLGAAISVVALGILTEIATNLLPAAYQPPTWMAWTALAAVAIIFALFYFWQDRVTDGDRTRLFSTTTGSKNLRKRYLQHLIDAYQYLEFKGIVQFEKLPLRMSLEKVFVNLWARPELPAGETLAAELRLAGRRLPTDDELMFDDEIELMTELEPGAQHVGPGRRGDG